MQPSSVRPSQVEATKGASVEVRKALKTLVMRALLLRFAVVLFVHFVGVEYSLAPDSETYDFRAGMLARYWSGESLVYPWKLTDRREPLGYYHFVAAVYLVAGQYPLLPKLLNALAGALCVPLVFRITARIGGSEPAALLAARYAAYFPSLVLWSSMNIRDVWVVLLILLICHQALSLQVSPTMHGLAFLAVGVRLLTEFRSYLLFAITLPILIVFLFRDRAHMLRNVTLGMVFAFVIVYADAAAGQNRRMRTIDWEDLQAARQWSSNAAESGFYRDVDVSSPAKALAFLPIGLTYFMLAPFPWTVANFRQGITIPEMLFFYALIPSIVVGVRALLREQLSGSLMLILISAAISFGYAVGQGNVGTIYRHRAQVLPFFLIFAAVGVEMKRARLRQALPG